MALLAVVDKDNIPDEARAVVGVSVLSLLTVNPEKVSPPEVRLKAPAPLFTTVALPVVLSVRLGVDVFMLPILPDPDDNDADVLPVNVPPVCVIVPEPEAARVTTAADTLAPSTNEPAVVRANVPPAPEAPLIVVVPLLVPDI